MTKKFSSPSYREWYSTSNLLPAYPSLEKLLSRNRERIRSYLIITLETIQHNTTYAHGFVSERYLANRLNKTNAHANKLLNYFCVLGILEKRHQGKLEYIEEYGDQGDYAITYQIARRSQRALQKIEERAAIILANKLTMSSMSWEAVRSCFGKELANQIYREERDRGVTPQLFESAFKDALKRLTVKGWTTKEELLLDVAAQSSTSKSVTERRFGELKPALNGLGYAYKRTSKKDAQAVDYDLPTGRYLIFRR